MEKENKKALYQKMFQVMDNTKAIDKNMTVGSGKNSYPAVSEAEILNEIKPLLKAAGLIIFPVEGDMEDHVMEYEKYDKKTLRAITSLKAKYKIVDVETGQSEILVGFGNGADPQDKGPGKAFTYSYKNMLAKTFMLFSGEDTDNQHSDEIERQQQTSSGKPKAKTPASKGKAPAPDKTSGKPAAKPEKTFTMKSKLPSGEFKGSTLEEVAIFDKDYVKNLSENSKDARVRKAATDALMAAEN